MIEAGRRVYWFRVQAYNRDMDTTTSGLWKTLREGSELFQSQGNVYTTLRQLVTNLNEAQVDYAIIGGMALITHGYRRFTEDVDILMTPAGLEQFKEHFIGRGYVLAFAAARKSFRDPRTGVKVEVVVTGEYPGDGLPKPVVFPDPAQVSVDIEGVRVIRLEKLIELKLASGLSAPHRLKDLADVQELIRILNLPLALSAQLDPSVRGEYERLWGTINRD